MVLTNLLEVLTEIHGLSGRLNPSAFESRVEEWVKGGMPGQSMSDGRGGEPSLPVAQRVTAKDENGEPIVWGPIGPSDPADADATAAVRAHRAHLDRALAELRRVEEIELEWSAMPHLAAEFLARQLTNPDSVKCQNCRRTVENTPADRLRGGRCSACAVYWGRHGRDRPRELWEAEIARQAEKTAKRGLQPAGRIDAKGKAMASKVSGEECQCEKKAAHDEHWWWWSGRVMVKCFGVGPRASSENVRSNA